MTPAGKLGAFALVLGLALGGGAAVGNVVGPIDVEDANDGDGTGGHGEHDSAEAQPASVDAGETLPGGVLISQDGYTLEAERTLLDGAPGAPFRFRIAGPDGTAVRDFELNHEREMHLVIVGRELQRYAHLHPSRGSDGTWSVDLAPLAPGAYRAFADFVVADGPELTLGVDLTVAGASQSTPLPPAAATATVDDYQVELAGTPAAGSDSELQLTVSRGGEPVTDLSPYLGVAGHLVAIRAGDLAYLHVHPLDESERTGPSVRFAVEVPSPGAYRLFFDFSHEGRVRTAAFTVHVPASGGHGGGDQGHDHETTEAP